MDIERALDRFFAKVQRTDSCWLWTGGTTNDGYGVFWNGERLEGAHRFAYRMFKGEIPEGLEPDHTCRITSCVNPDCLELVTHRENVLRGTSPNAVNAAKTRCDHGHELAGRNLLIDYRGRRKCRECRNRLNREYRARRKAARGY